MPEKVISLVELVILENMRDGQGFKYNATQWTKQGLDQHDIQARRIQCQNWIYHTYRR